jgi:Tfp pilus assembly protein PilF
VFAKILLGFIVKNEDYSNAEMAVRQALAVDHNDEHARYLFGVVRLHRGYCNEAHDIGADLFLHDRDESYKRPAWSLSIATCDDAGSADRFLSEGRPDLAIGFYKAALREDPNSYRAQHGLANAYRGKGMQAEADAAEAKAERMHLSR